MDDAEVRAFAAGFARLSAEVHQLAQGNSGDESLSARLTDHLGVDPTTRSVTSLQLAPHEHANIDLALAAWVSADGHDGTLLGISGGHGTEHHSLAELVTLSHAHGQFGIGAPAYRQLSVSAATSRSCVQLGLFLLTAGQLKLAVLLRGPSPQGGALQVRVEVLGREPAESAALLDELTSLMAQHNIFRRQLVSFTRSDFDPQGAGPLQFHHRAGLERADLILPELTLAGVERQILGIARQRDRLVEAGQHLKRGVLLYGPPGTGKTLTVRYLCSALTDFTIVLLTGPSIVFIAQACSLARALQPALVVLEDCDLVANQRDPRGGAQPLLFQVLDEMDGLAADADITFLLTTNRAEVLERALIQRPGRIDLAVEIPLPDAEARRALLVLYGSHLELPEDLIDRVVAGTDGVAASFLKELIRRAVLLAAEADSSVDPAHVEAAHVEAALSELSDSADALNRAILGGRSDGPSPHPRET